MEIAWSKILPVLVSIGVILLVAFLREYSKTFAAVAATMPINVPLGLWIVYAAEGTDKAAMEQFSRALLINIWPTIVFMVIVWLAARAGWTLIPMLLAGYAGWAVGLVMMLLLRHVLGF